MASHDPLTGTTPSTASSSIVPSIPPSDNPRSLPTTHNHHIWYVTGPAGCGKTTAATYLASTWGVPYLEGDNFHPPANISKMAAGEPLTDSDRWSWLRGLSSAARGSARSHGAVMVTCSALKKSYRDELRSSSLEEDANHVKVHFLYLALSPEELVRRVQNRKGHYMKAEMVRSQLEALEEPDETERKTDSVVVDAGRTYEEVEREVRVEFERIMMEDKV